MNKPIEFDLIQHRQALDDWLADCNRRMGLRFPKIDFDSDEWPIRVLYQTEQRDWYFTEPMADFAEKDISYRDALRCLVAEMLIDGKQKALPGPISAYRQLALASPHQLFYLTLADLRRLEERFLAHAKGNPQAANHMATQLSTLSTMMVQLSRKGVLPALGFHAHASTKAELRKIAVAYRAKMRDGKGDRLDRAMEAFNDAFNRMVDGAPELSARDRMALCTGVLLLCAPSRINEILCMSIDDHVTVEDYAQKPVEELDETHRAHQMLIMTMKGSKGAQWSPKPVLSFMMDVFHYSVDIIKAHGKRSRRLVEWYQKHPDALYLPPELEYLRGQVISRRDLERIVRLDGNLPDDSVNPTANNYFKELLNRQFKRPNPANDPIKGRVGSHSLTDYLPWADVETLLLNKVRAAMDRCRRVTSLNHYRGDLAKMLFLFDNDATPFQPRATAYGAIKPCLKRSAKARQKRPQRSLFEKLKITMPVDGKIQIAAMDTHDPRRWLTTMALIHGEKLSDVLINKWANRCKLSTLWNYDFRTPEMMAAQASMPEAKELNELTDLSAGLAAVEKLEEQFGLQIAVVTAHDAGIAMTTLDNVAEAVDNRPVARTSRGIIIIYPQRFGICLHQHHEKPCRNYSNDLSASCITCNEGAHVKGHIPTNDETRMLAEKLFKIIISHLENLALTHNRGVADDPAALGEHMLTLIEKGLSPFLLQQLAIDLIENFHVKQIGHRLKDRMLARRLEEAHAAMGVVKELDNPDRPSGALIKYHNPARHSEPLLEIALDEHGGREQVERDEQALIAKYPEFAPKAVGLQDERHLIAPDDNEGED
jgi:hypothetical protein